MKEVVVLVESFKDLENYNKIIDVKRNGKTIKLHRQLLLKGDIYSISKERCSYLSKKKIVEEVKINKETPTAQND